MNCPYCERPLHCETCGAEFEPRDRAQHEAMSRPEAPILCPSCEDVLTCHWCKTPFVGSDEDESEAT